MLTGERTGRHPCIVVAHTGRVPHPETNVRILPGAHDALAKIVSDRQTARDEVIRQLLTEYVSAQERRDADDRLTHISTVLRYPPPPRWRGDPRKDRPLRVRAPRELIERARAVALSLPGQSPRAHRDYQSRLLTDAVTTAIAMHAPIHDDYLDALPALIHHLAALSLWKLAMAASSTGPERAILEAAANEHHGLAAHAVRLSHGELSPGPRLQRIAEALGSDEAWHSPNRFTVVANVARELLTGADAADNEAMLHQAGGEFDEIYFDVLGADDARRDELLAGTTGFDEVGRAGTAAWRAERRVELQDFADWLTRGDADDAAYRVDPPGWHLRRPTGWRAVLPAHEAVSLPDPYARWAAEYRVLTLEHRCGAAIWPLMALPGGGGLAPVPGFEPVAAAARALSAEKVSALVEAVLVDWNSPHSDEELRIALEIPADKAYRLGYITAAERTQAMARARAATIREMTEIIERLDAGRRHLRPQLEEAMRSTREFEQIASSHGLNFVITRASWRWPGRTVADDVAADTDPELLAHLVNDARAAAGLLLEQAMHTAWQIAFDQYRAATSR